MGLGRTDTRVDIGSQERRRNGKIVRIYLASSQLIQMLHPVINTYRQTLGATMLIAYRLTERQRNS